MDYKELAKSMFFEKGLSINEIALATGVSRRSISSFLNVQEGYKEERERRKALNASKRKEYKRKWERTHRSSSLDKERLKRQHEIDVRVLSMEKY